MNDATDKTEQKAEEAIDSVIAESAADQSTESAKKPVVKQSSGSRVLMFLLLIIVLVLAGLAAGGQLQPLYEKVMASFADTQSADLSTDTEPLLVATEPDAPLVATETKPEPEIEPFSAPEKPEQPAGLNDEVSELLSTIHQLRLEMRDMILSQRALQDGLIEQQQMNVQVRLRWIADPASRLSQVQLAWEEISLLPGLSESQRAEATDMHSLARSN
ncbi:MAG: hypothetical protein ACE5E3_05315, partial [Mariprofundus sp.]